MTKVGTRKVKVGCEFIQSAASPTSIVMQVQPLIKQPVVLLNERWDSEPTVTTHSYTDLYDNRCLRMTLPAGTNRFVYSAVAEVPDATEDFNLDAPELPVADLPDGVLIYTLPSRYCLPDLLEVEARDRFGNSSPGYTRVQEVLDYVWNHVTFQYGSSTAFTTAFDVNNARFGVCRDFAHLAISFCRALEIPARYVFGYLPEIDFPPTGEAIDFAAWIEVWLGDRWWTFDPRNNARRKGRVLIGRGRDAADVAMVTAFGYLHLESMAVTAEEFPGGS